jgi:hypothetical protein
MTSDTLLFLRAVRKPAAPHALKASFSIGANLGMAAATSGTVGPSPLRYCSVAKIGTWRIPAP